MNKTANLKEISNIIEALSRHADESAVQVLEELGTNSNDDLVREMTVQALIKRNTHDALRVALIYKGKGIHDMNASVVESAINSLKTLNDKSEALRILDDTINLHSDYDVKLQASFVKDQIVSNN